MSRFKLSALLSCAILIGLCRGLLVSLFPSTKSVYAQPPATWTGRKFYLTKNAVVGGAALNACSASAGYHMASLWEIYNVSGLQYDTTLGITTDDSGSGPPSVTTKPDFGIGWIRTGSFASAGIVQSGAANCNAWRSSSSSDTGTAARLNPAWYLTPYPYPSVAPWLPSGSIAASCNTGHPVWCVQN